MTKKIAVLPGDGIGPEITEQCVRVLQSLRPSGLALEFETAAVGGAGFDQAKDPLPQATVDLCESADAILFGAVGGRNTIICPAPCAQSKGF